MLQCSNDGKSPLSDAHVALVQLLQRSRDTSLDYAPRDWMHQLNVAGVTARGHESYESSRV